MNGMNYVIMSNMSTSMNALCRHVTKINHRGLGGLGGMITFLFINVPACAFVTRCSCVCALLKWF